MSADPPSRQAILDRLSEPFQLDEVKFKPAVVKENRALCLAYVDARTIMDRLDDVLGLGNWSTSYRELPDGVVCKLRLRIGDEWIEHEDVGSFSEQPDDGDKLKAAFSDALKRAAVHVGVSRYLYRLPQQWTDYDPKSRKVAVPKLPAWALPRPAEPKAPPAPAAKPAAIPMPAPAAPTTVSGIPKTGAELVQRLLKAQADLQAKGLIAGDELLDHVVAQGVARGYPRDPNDWSDPKALAASVQMVKNYLAWLAAPKPDGPSLDRIVAAVRRASTSVPWLIEQISTQIGVVLPLTDGGLAQCPVANLERMLAKLAAAKGGARATA